MYKISNKEIDGIQCQGILFDGGEFHVFAKERIKILKEKNISYSVTFSEDNLSEDKWKVKAYLTIHGALDLSYENYAIRSGDYGLEIASTIALSRAIAIAGYGSKYGIGTAEGYRDYLSNKPANDAKKFFENKKAEKSITPTHQEPKVIPKEKAKEEPIKKIKPTKPPKEKKEELPTVRPKAGTKSACIAYLDKHNIDYTKFVKTGKIDELRALMSHHKTNDLVEFVTLEYGTEAAVFCGKKVEFKEELKSTFVKQNPFKKIETKKEVKPKITKESEGDITESTPRSGAKLELLIKKFEDQHLADSVILQTLKYAGITEYKSLVDFLTNGEKSLLETLMLEFGIQWEQ